MRSSPPEVRRDPRRAPGRHRLVGAGVLLFATMLVFTVAGPAAGATPLAPSLLAHATGNELVQVGSESPVVLAINAETTADMVQVDITIPAGFTPDRQSPLEAKGGGVGGLFVTWDARYSGQEITATGAGVAQGGILIVSFTGKASRVGTLQFMTVTHASDGTTVRGDGAALSAHPAAFVHVLRTLTSAQVNATTASGPPASHPPTWAIGVAGIGGLTLIGCFVSRRRHRSSGRIPRKVLA
jgi:hypothetical protein